MFPTYSEPGELAPEKIKIRKRYGFCIGPKSHYSKKYDYTNFYNLVNGLRFKFLQDMVYLEESDVLIGKLYPKRLKKSRFRLITNLTYYHRNYYRSSFPLIAAGMRG